MDESIVNKLGEASKKNSEAIGRAILLHNPALSALLLEIGELIDDAIDDASTSF